ncbi:response regulator [Ruminococcus sp. HUN007]|uniref:response regulator n=1 Tax=Ruminococcus sp. HUN007 TaxID=1514668 RepID=UPI0005D16143|nr:response regulator [Ruminococcus sp. HUN007]
MYEVLIVEDDPMVAMINRQYVNENKKFHVAEVCRDGKSALEYLESHEIHLIILDVYMPRTDGLEFLKMIRGKNIPASVIMVTAANDGKTIEEAVRLGVVDYLVKPFFNDRFQQALEKFLAMKNTFHELSSFSQHHIDSLIGNSAVRESALLPKGIQDQTLDTIKMFLLNNSSSEFTGEEIADKVNLSRVTVRRYMNYLIEQGFISGKMNYETGGRPCMIYTLKKS